MSAEIKPESILRIFQPDGAQGAKIGIGCTDNEFEQLIQELNQLPPEKRSDLTEIRDIAERLELPLVKP